MAEMTKCGHVYIISNVGPFGDEVVKIGFTRRLDPEDRVRELGGPSVPFLFDTHAIIYSDDPPMLEAALHTAFHGRRVNTANLRKEFFRAGLAEVEAAVARLAPAPPTSATARRRNITRPWHAGATQWLRCGRRSRAACPRRSEPGRRAGGSAAGGCPMTRPAPHHMSESASLVGWRGPSGKRRIEASRSTVPAGPSGRSGRVGV